MFTKFTYAVYEYICALLEFSLKISIYCWQNVAVTKTSISVSTEKFHILSKVNCRKQQIPGRGDTFFRQI